ncbi:MAG: Mrp/NBP35 family ATP-binding protein [Deltaproteobacteria bacterium]|uniref:Iron-sulfur cluster carrier protein n=1 Tax=Candidatus Zymogenus saltonus TaxID=2844893 RepID=A0A9D8KEE3_9DELT|nr:Mrp/NBP35 family ATP-binding protein [Candidatus Zymogenus saltonus]
MSNKECDKDSTCSTCNASESCTEKDKERHAEDLLKMRLGRIGKKIMVMSGKGGVGKSTVAANLAVFLAMEGFEVGLLDADIHGPNIPKMLGLEDERLRGSEEGIIPVRVMEGLSVISVGYLLEDRDTPVIWRGAMKHGVIKQFLGEVNWGDLDFLIVDLPPGTGDEPLSVAQLIGSSEGSIVVTTPQDVALLDSRKSVNFSKRLNVPVLGIVENMSGFKCPHCGKEINLFKVGGGEKAAKEMGVPFLGRIPVDTEIMESGDSGRPFVRYLRDSETFSAFSDIMDSLMKRLDVGKVRKKAKT